MARLRRKLNMELLLYSTGGIERCRKQTICSYPTRSEMEEPFEYRNIMFRHSDPRRLPDCLGTNGCRLFKSKIVSWRLRETKDLIEALTASMEPKLRPASSHTSVQLTRQELRCCCDKVYIPAINAVTAWWKQQAIPPIEWEERHLKFSNKLYCTISK